LARQGVGGNVWHDQHPPEATGAGFAASETGWTERLGQAMFQLNVIAVDARYGSGEAKRFRPLDYHYEVPESVPLVQVLKSLQCWLYQCDEGDVPQTALYMLFDNVVQLYLMTEIIDALPEYQNAYWGKYLVSSQSGQVLASRKRNASEELNAIIEEKVR
jgi:hypothetical protein